MNSGIVFLEINEVPYRVLDYYVEKCPRSATASLMAESTQFVTFCNDEVELDPWISWPTLHRGVNDTAHGILRLGQILDNADKRYPPIWRILADHKVRVGLFGSVHSGHIPEDLTNYPFYVPDFFDDEVFAHPAHLLPFQRGDHAGFDLGVSIVVLHQGVHKRGEFGAAFLASGHVSVTDETGFRSHRASCHGHFTEVECRTATTGATTYHN